MAPVPIPAEKKETFTLDGTGVFLLTQEQRNSRKLSIVVEKIYIGPKLSYWNFRIPEPSTFWGYIQSVSFDSIIKTIELKYRREVILFSDNYELESVEQLRCLIKDSTLLLFDNLVPLLLAAGANAAAIGQDRANYLLKNGQPRLIPTTPETGIYYEIEGNHLCQVTIIWQDYAVPCQNPAGNQPLSPPRGTGKNETSPNAPGGGGTRPSTPPPPNRSTDPDSDSPAPPPDTPTGPPSPIPEPIIPPPTGVPYLVLYDVYLCSANNPPPGRSLQFSYSATTILIGPVTVFREADDPRERQGFTDFLGAKTYILSTPLTDQGCSSNSEINITSQTPVP